MPFTQEHLLKDYKEKTLTGVIFGITIIPTVIFEFQDTVDSSKCVGLSVDSVFSNIRKEILDILDSDPLVKARFLAIFDEILEMELSE